MPRASPRKFSRSRRYTLRANTDARKVARWLKMGTNTMLTYEEAEQADEGEPALVEPFACRLMLPYWNPYREDGSIASKRATAVGRERA